MQKEKAIAFSYIIITLAFLQISRYPLFVETSKVDISSFL